MKLTKAIFKPSKTFIAISLAASTVISTNAFSAESCDGINTYPNFPAVDWEGNPDHANTGDLMQFNGSAYAAKWWTTSTPGSDNTWDFKYECTDGTPDPDPTP
ncbi:MAG TPA: chitodextrinase, partial [Colwellia sp.]|nr:chitodextrinase [Colwellia sp.]